jgi:electron transport complex protein RnfC
MKTFPLIRTRLSNERLMTALVVVLLLWNLPRFLKAPGSIVEMLILLATGLILDAVCQFILNKRIRCAVSGAVTVLILWTLSPGVPFWAQAAAVAVALVAGKAVWGGTGKNLLNPAMLGLSLLSLFYPVGFTAPDLALLLPAAVLSLPFLLMRPYAAIGYIAGMAVSLLMLRGLPPSALLSSGVIFWGCLVLTDPVTTTSRPAAGCIIGFLAGLIPDAAGGTGLFMALGILSSNILSYLADRYKLGNGPRDCYRFTGGLKIRFLPTDTPFVDLTDLTDDGGTTGDVSPEKILAQIDSCGVFGCGGAAFPAGRKIHTVLASKSPQKHLIVNAAECDPGLIHDKWLLINRTDGLLRGISYLTSCIAFDTVTIAAKDFFDVSFVPPVKTHRVKDYYPAGAEKLLIREILRKTPEEGIAPAEAGILVLNIQTVIAVDEAVRLGRTASTRYLTAADLDRRTGTVVRAELGADVLETARRVYPDAVNIFTGGGAMGAALAGDGDPVTNKTNFIARGSTRGFREAACSQCDFCSMYCPSGLRVRDLAHLADAGRMEEAILLQPEKCIGCGLCSAVCLAGRDQAARVRAAVTAGASIEG